MPLPDALVATLALTGVLDELAVPYLVAGSLASSYHGIPRSTADADLVAALTVEHTAPLLCWRSPICLTEPWLTAAWSSASLRTMRRALGERPALLDDMVCCTDASAS